MSEQIDLNDPAGEARARELMPDLFREDQASCRLDGDTQVIGPVPGGARYCLHLPFHTARLNELMAGVKVKIRLRRRDDAAVAGAAARSGIPQATGPRRVSLLVVLRPGQRAGDPDGWWKSLLDSLVRCRLLVDDGARHCELGPVEFARGPRAAMYIRLEELSQ